jgi:hypothetical protein
MGAEKILTDSSADGVNDEKVFEAFGWDWPVKESGLRCSRVHLYDRQPKPRLFKLVGHALKVAVHVISNI